MSSINTVAYGVAIEQVRVLKSWMGVHHLENTLNVVECIKNVKLEEGQCITPYGLSALFTLVPLDSAVNIIKNKLEQNEELQDRTNMSVAHIITLPPFCLKATYFFIYIRFYVQIKWATMISPVSPIVANLLMEDWRKGSKNSWQPPTVSKKYMSLSSRITCKHHQSSYQGHCWGLEAKLVICHSWIHW